MINQYLYTILLVTGAVTATMVFQFLSPRHALKAFNDLTVDDELTLFFARGMGLAVTSMGVLLIWAAFVAPLRTPVLVVALVAKMLFVLTMLGHWKTIGKGYMASVCFDCLCVALFLGALGGF